MQTTWKKVLSVLLTFCLMFSLAACNSQGGTPASDEAVDGGGQTQEETPVSDEVVDGGGQIVEIALLDVDAKAQITDLKTQGMTNPIGIDTETPYFSWRMQSDITGAAQTRYQIVVRDPSGKIVWDSKIVESQDSVDIPYSGDALQACTRYTWTVSVTDTAGSTVESEEAFFETGLMNTSQDAWNGAQWIGAEELTLDAASACVFNIRTGVQIPEGSTSASLILGAGDFRLKNSVYNINSMADENNYVRVELDIGQVTAEGGAQINVYRVGFAPNDSADTPVLSFDAGEAVTQANKNAAHTLELLVCSSKIQILLDGTTVGKDVVVNDQVTAPGNTSNYNTYPNLNCVGFAGDAVFTDYTIENGGDYGTGVLFGEKAGATYTIFEGLDGVTVSGNAISVEGDSVRWADPSYGAAPMLRKDFTLKDSVQSARLYITAHGIYNFYINGQEVAPAEWFNPGNSEYDALLGYKVYDVTELLSTGTNAMGAQLGEGWWTGHMTYNAINSNYYGDQPSLMAMLTVEYADGSTETLVTDTSWQSYLEGPVRLASFFQGERYDATIAEAMSGWSEAGYAANGWQNAAVIETRAPFKNAQLITRFDTPVHVIYTDTAVKSLGETEPGSGTYVYDMGTNVSGTPLITIPADFAKEGETLTIRFAEILYPDIDEYVSAGLVGNLMVENYRAALVTDFYTMCSGDQVFAPDLTWHGYRYIEIAGLGKELPAEYVERQVLSSLDPNGSYDSSNPLANQLYANIVNSAASNYISIPTDCPQRNERLGWTGDAQVFALSGSYLADTYNFMNQWMDSVRADSGESGMSSQYSPAYVAYDLGDSAITHKGQSFGITWNALAVTIPYNLYMQTGRTDIIEQNIDNIYAYIDTLLAKPLSYKDADGNQHEDARLTGEIGSLADHLARVNTNSALLGNCVFIACLDEAAIMAEAVGDSDKAEAFREKAADARTAWNELFIDSATGKTVTSAGDIQDTQASYATPLRFGVISEENMEKVLPNYEATIAHASGVDSDGLEIPAYTITTGFNATGNVLNALSDHGLNNTAYKLFESTEYASWLYPITLGATSIWERWNAYTEEGGFNGNNAMNSFNHYADGAVCEWMLGYQAGIVPDPSYPGYQQFILQPTPGGSFRHLTASYDSPYGLITSGWEAENGELVSYSTTVPANTVATLYLPTDATNGTDAAGVTYVGQDVHNGAAVQVYQLVAGNYSFSISDGNITIQ